MKKLLAALLCLVLLGLCACGEAVPNEIAPYSRIIRRYKRIERIFGNLDDQYYALYDIDGNGTKELLLAENRYSNGIDPYSIFTIHNGVAVKQEEFAPLGEGGSIPASLIFKNGTIMFDNGFDERWLNYFRFEEGELKFQFRLIRGIDTTEGDYYRSDLTQGTPITKEEFEQLQKEFEGDGQIVEQDWKPLAEYKRSRKDLR